VGCFGHAARVREQLEIKNRIFENIVATQFASPNKFLKKCIDL
jgi:hypothetical protein